MLRTGSPLTLLSILVYLKPSISLPTHLGWSQKVLLWPQMVTWSDPLLIASHTFLYLSSRCPSLHHLTFTHTFRHLHFPGCFLLRSSHNFPPPPPPRSLILLQVFPVSLMPLWEVVPFLLCYSSAPTLPCLVFIWRQLTISRCYSNSSLSMYEFPILTSRILVFDSRDFTYWSFYPSA